MTLYNISWKTGTSIAILFYWAIIWVTHLISIVYGYRKLYRRRVPPTDAEVGVYGVSILKPLVGRPIDPNLLTNIESFFTMSYNKYELLFCIQEESDPSIMVVEELRKKYPAVDSSIFIGGSQVGINPKINNMNPGFLAAKHDLLLVSDSNMLMKEDTLSDMVSYMRSDIGIVHQMPFTCDRKGWPSTLEKVYFGTNHARHYLFFGFLDYMGLGANCCTGMSCLMRKKVICDAGGLASFGAYLAEDYFLAKCIQDRGWGIRISSQPAWQNAGNCTVQSFVNRLTRWCKLRVAMLPHTIFLEPFSESIILGLATSWAAVVLFNANYLAFFLVHELVWALCDWIRLNIVQNGPLPFSRFEFLLSWLFREASALFVFLRALWNPVIKWRTASYKLKWFGVVEPLKKKVSIYQ